jgi:hypothetical protein
MIRRSLLSTLIGFGLVAVSGIEPGNISSASAAGPYQTAHVEVRESNYDVDTGLFIRYNDKVEFSCSGSVWSGVWFTDINGPNGWSNITYDPKYPLTGTNPYKALAKLNSRYFSVGGGTIRQHRNADSRLYMRVNDDAPGNGTGAFFCDIWVNR